MTSHSRGLLGAAVASLAGFVVGWFPLRASDLGHHIATGRYVLHTRTIPHADPFSWTAAGETWYLYQWILDCLFAWTEGVGGVVGLVVLRACATALMAAALFFSAHVRSKSVLASVSIVVLAMPMMQSRLYLRPMLAGYVLLALLDGLFTLWEQDGRRAVRFLAHGALVLWAALHPLFVIGALRFIFHAALELMRGRTRVVVHLAAAALITVVTVQAVAAFGLESLWSVLVSGKDPYLSQVIVELHPFYARYPFEWTHGALFALVAAAFFTNDEPLLARLLRFAPLLVFTYGFLTMARLWPTFVVLAIPFAARGVVVVAKELQRRAPAIRCSWTQGACALAAAVVLGLHVHAAPYGFGAKRAENFYPRAAGAALQEIGPKRVYNDLRFGGFLLWDLRGEVRPFMDGRLEVYGYDFMRNFYRRIYTTRSGWKAHLDALGVDAVMLSSERAPKLQSELREDAQWKLVFQDPFAVIFTRTMP